MAWQFVGWIFHGRRALHAPRPVFTLLRALLARACGSARTPPRNTSEGKRGKRGEGEAGEGETGEGGWRHGKGVSGRHGIGKGCLGMTRSGLGVEGAGGRGRGLRQTRYSRPPLLCSRNNPSCSGATWGKSAQANPPATNWQSGRQQQLHFSSLSQALLLMT